MKNTKIIANRFSPANTNPVFFCGRHRITTEMFLALNNFEQSTSHFQKHLHLLVGAKGTGKTALLKHLHKQIINSKEMVKFLPIYVCMKMCETEKSIYLSIVAGLEQSCRQNPYRHQQLERVLKKKLWLNEASFIAPHLTRYLRKDMTEFTIFEFLRSLEKNPCSYPMTVDLVKLLHLLVNKCSLNIFITFDHMFKALQQEKFQELLTDCFNEIEKFNSRIFSIIAIEEENFRTVKNTALEQEQSGTSRLLQHSNLSLLKSDIHLTNSIDGIINSTKGGERFSVFAIAPNCGWEKVTSAFKSRLVAEFETVTLECNTDNFETFLREACDVITEKCDSINKASFTSTSTAKMLKIEIHRKTDLDEVIAYFGKLLTRLDSIIGEKLVIVLENYQQFIQQQRTFSTIKKNSIKEQFLLPSPTFIKFFNALFNYVSNCKNIHIIPVMQMPLREYSFYEKHLVSNMLSNANMWQLGPFSDENTSIFLSEIFSRCGLVLQNKTITNIYQKTKGNPLLLNLVGYYVISLIEKHLVKNDVSLLHTNLMTKNKIKDGLLTVGQLKQYTDERVRIEVNQIFCHKIQEKTLHSIYRELWNDLTEKTSAEVIKYLLEEDLLSRETKKKYLNAEKISETTKYLKNEGLIEEKDNIIFIHDVIRDTFKVYQNKFSSTENVIASQPQKKISFDASQQIIRLKNKHKISPTEKKHRRDIDPSTNNDTKILHLDSMSATNHNELLEYVTILTKEGQIPTRSVLEKISEKINLDDEISLGYLGILCQKICENTGIINNNATIAVINNFKQHNNLYIAINSAFCSENILNACIMGKKYEQLHKLYKLKYTLEQSQTYLQKTIEFSFQYIQTSIVLQETPKLICETMFLVSQINNEELQKNLYSVGEYYHRFINIIHNKSDHCTDLLLAEQMPILFLPYLMNCCVNTIEQNIGEATNIACLQLLLQFPQCIKKHPALFHKILPILSTHTNTNVRYSFYDFLIYAIPMLEVELRKEVFILLLDASQQEQHKVQSKVIEVINSYILLMPEEETFFLLQSMIENDNCDFDVWVTLMRLWNILPENAQTSLKESCVIFYAQNTEKFQRQPLKAVPFLHLIQSEQELLYNYILKQLCSNDSSILPHINNILMDIELQKNQQQDIRNLLIDIIKLIPKKEQRAYLLCNKYFTPQDLDIFDHSLEQVEYLNCQMHFFGQYSSEEQQEIINQLKHHLTSSVLLIHNLHKITMYCSVNDLEEFMQICTNFIKENGPEDKISQEIMRNAKYLFVRLPQETNELFNVIFSYLLDSKYYISYPAILEGLNYFPSDISLRDIQQAISNIFNIQPVFSDKTIRYFYEFLDLALGFGLRYSLVEKIQKVLGTGIRDYKYAEIAMPIYLKHFHKYEEVFSLLDIYQLNVQTWHIAFAFFNIFPEKLDNVAKLKSNYEQVKNLENVYLEYKIIDICYRLGEQTLAEEKLNSLLKNAIIPSYKRHALQIQQKWSIKLHLDNNYVTSSLSLKELI
ncbi:hypothetical protein [Candidatus Uabimicrobium sp. HlEnr_7]|uniref:hypothetical protein n=1 Tax=Candidatus Uabimicrobium helgolandensis TaxID=3095367 RepID=UPI003556782A